MVVVVLVVAMVVVVIVVVVLFLSTARWIYKKLFFVGYFIKYGQYRSIKVNHSQLRLIKVN